MSHVVYNIKLEDNLIPFNTSCLTGNKVLVLAPHPDDETLGCGGSLALHSLAQDSTKVIFVTDGAQGDSSGQQNKGEYVKLREQEAKAACEQLGVYDIEFWGYPDRDLLSITSLPKRLAKTIKKYQPQIIYVPSPLELHPDHRACCMFLCQTINTLKMDLTIAFYEVGQPLFLANTLIDITSIFDKKLRAIDAYKSQLKERCYKDFMIGLNRYRSLSLSANSVYAEAFFLCKKNDIGDGDILALMRQRLSLYAITKSPK